MPLNISVLTRHTSSCRNSCWTRTTKPTSHRRYNSTTTYRCSSVYPNSIPTSKYICPSRRKRNSSHSKIFRKALRLPAKWVLLRTAHHLHLQGARTFLVDHPGVVHEESQRFELSDLKCLVINIDNIFILPFLCKLSGLFICDKNKLSVFSHHGLAEKTLT